MELEKKQIENIFQNIDGILKSKKKALDLIIIGGAVVIQLNMPERTTMDIDLFGNEEEAKVLIKSVATELNIPFDPDSYQFLENPYIQWVNPHFIHMPDNDEWKNDIEAIWKGKFLNVYRPPIGIIIGSKLAAAREKDIVDARYLVEKFSDWKKSLDKYLPLFSTEDQQEIKDNKIYIDLYLSRLKKEKNKSIQNPRTFVRKK